MKSKVFYLLVLAGTLFFFSCSKDKGASPSTSNGTMELKVEGNAWSATLAVAAVNTNGVINVTGSDSQSKQASVILYGVDAPGTYTLNNSQSNQFRWTEGLGQADTYVANFLAGTGTITITELTASTIKATFEFTGYNNSQNSKVITEGVINANF